MQGGVSRFLSRKDKKSKESSSSKNNAAKDIYRVFVRDEKKKLDREEEKKIKILSLQLEIRGITSFKDSNLEYALRSASANGDVDKALDLLLLFEDSVNGVLRPPQPNTKLLGAENREMVTCYLDSLLFSMYARLDSFESILSQEYNDQPRKTLAILLRLWANLVRSGKLVTVDITKHLQEALADCGWDEARRLAQQDVSEAFSFVTDKLGLPLLELQMDVYHSGKEDRDDHRTVSERLLNVAIPNVSPEGTVIKLEDCLEQYFNNRIEVKRDLQRRNTISSFRDREPEKGSVVQVEMAQEESSSHPGRLIFKSRVDSSPSKDAKARDDIQIHPGYARRSKSTVFRKNVSIPAWQFFNLIPWNTPHRPKTDDQVVEHFSNARPCIGICLKRYSMNSDRSTTRSNTYIDIPLECRLPHFVFDKEDRFENFKISLQSVICHRGVSLDAGHYICLVRPNSQIRTNSAHKQPNIDSTDPANENADITEFQWLRFDDLAKERVEYTDIRKALKEETPYLLFYQVLPLEAPPSYSEAMKASAEDSETNLNPSMVAHDSPLSSQSTILVNPSKDSLPPKVSDTAQTSAIPTGMESIPTTTAANSTAPSSTTDLHHSSSAPAVTPTPKDNEAPRPTSIDLYPTKPRTSESSNKRVSAAFTEYSFVPSAPITPSNELLSKDGGYLGVTQVPLGASAAATFPNLTIRDKGPDSPALQSSPEKRDRERKIGSISKRKGLGHHHQHHDESGRERHSWLGLRGRATATGEKDREKEREDKEKRPVSQPPAPEKGSGISSGVGNFVRNLRGAVSWDRLGASANGGEGKEESSGAPADSGVEKDEESSGVDGEGKTSTESYEEEREHMNGHTNGSSTPKHSGGTDKSRGKSKMGMGMENLKGFNTVGAAFGRGKSRREKAEKADREKGKARHRSLSLPSSSRPVEGDGEDGDAKEVGKPERECVIM